ncbi:MAG: hypothetical protein LAT51_00830 [Flavobacteriaceae bacterium]|nr:hypothetical protein [Flavobacteriaceae bacterium]
MLSRFLHNKVGLLLLSFTMVCISSFAQDESSAFVENSKKEAHKKNDFLYNPVYTYIGAIDLTYERIINEKSGAGVRFTYTFIDEFIDLKTDLALFYRRYYGNKPAGGFYNEAYLSYNRVENHQQSLMNGEGMSILERSNNLGIGFALGTKLISKDGILLDLGAGVAYNFYRSDFNNRVIPNLIVNFGFRF